MSAGNMKRLILCECVLLAFSGTCFAQAVAMPSGNAAVTVRHGTPTLITDFSMLARIDGPAVVHIDAYGVPDTQSEPVSPSSGDEDNPLFRFFQSFSPDGPEGAGATAERLGSGFIVTSNGYIMTASQVVAHANRVKVTLADGRTFDAAVVGNDAASGVALLKIDAHGLPDVPIGASSDAKAGQWIASIGAPYGLDNTVTAGIVSNTSRALPQDSYIPLIQTDMTEDAGDAGSPVVDMDGNVIGIEIPPQGANGDVQGLAFAIPVDEAMKVERQLQLHHQAAHGRLGITIQEVTGPLAQSFGLDQPVGALVSSVAGDGPSAKSGLKPGDVILRFDGAAITDSSQLPVAVADLRPGTRASLVYWRDHGTHETSVVLGRLDEASLVSAAFSPGALAPGGLAVRALTAEERHEAGVHGGVRVERSTGAAELAGIEPGDIVLMVDHTRVADPAQLREALMHHGKSVALLVQRDGERMFVTLDID
jgi:serine protease Do